MKIMASKKNFNNIATWADIQVDPENDPKEHFLKRVTLDVSAGDVVVMNVEEYDTSNVSNWDVHPSTIPTIVTSYYVKNFAFESEMVFDTKKISGQEKTEMEFLE